MPHSIQICLAHVLSNSYGVSEIFIYISHGRSMWLFYYNEDPTMCTALMPSYCEAGRKSTYYYIISYRIVVRCVINSSEPISMTFTPRRKESVERSAICGSMYHQRDYDVVPESIYKLIVSHETSQRHTKTKASKEMLCRQLSQVVAGADRGM